MTKPLAKPIAKPTIKQQSVLFVCLGNICRSPTAHGVFEKLLSESELSDSVTVDSAGTAAWHIGKAPDRRSIAMAKTKGYELAHLRARQVTEIDFYEFDYILAMDDSNYSDLAAIQPVDGKADLRMFLSFAANQPITEVPDPYYNGEESFREVVSLVETACHGLLDHLRTERTA